MSTATAGPATVPPCPAWCNVRPDDGYPVTGYHMWMWDFGKWTRMHAREFAYWIAVDISEEVYPDGSVTHRPPQASVELYSLDTPEVYEVADVMRSVGDFLKSLDMSTGSPPAV